MSCGRSRNAASSMYSGSCPRLYVTTALARFAGFVSMSVFTCGERMKLSGKNGPDGGSERTAACEPHPARTATRATAAAKRTSGGYLARPVLHGIGRGRHDNRRRDLVVPGLLLLVPEHPEVAEEAHDPGEDAPDPADERAAVADRPAGGEVDHADVQQLLADRLAGGAAFKVGEVSEAPQRADGVGQRPADHEQDAVHDREQNRVGQVGDEALAEVRARPGRAGARGRLVGRLLVRGVGHDHSLGSQRNEKRCSSKSQLAATTAGTAAFGRTSRAGRRTSRARAASTSRTPNGFAATASPRWRRTVCSTLVERPQSGHGSPVSARKGQW